TVCFYNKRNNYSPLYTCINSCLWVIIIFSYPFPKSADTFLGFWIDFHCSEYFIISLLRFLGSCYHFRNCRSIFSPPRFSLVCYFPFEFSFSLCLTFSCVLLYSVFYIFSTDKHYIFYRGIKSQRDSRHHQYSWQNQYIFRSVYFL